MSVRRYMIAALALASFAAIMPVCVVRGELRSGETVFSIPRALGGTFVTRYIHSVALTPVEDEYRALPGALWGWEERVLSHGAGLPFEAPPGGTFIVRGDVMIVRGGRTAHERIALRVGTRELGANVFEAPPFGESRVYEAMPRELILLSCGTSPLCSARTVWPPARAR